MLAPDEAIVRHRSLVDRHPRTGIVLGVLFLELHEFVSTAPPELATVAVLDLAAGRTGLDGFERFLRDHVRRREHGA